MKVNIYLACEKKMNYKFKMLLIQFPASSNYNIFNGIFYRK